MGAYVRERAVSGRPPSPAQPGEGHATGGYSDTRGYGGPVVGVMARRTAEREGAFFLAHLRPGMRVLDVGCGPGTITLGLARAVAPGEVVGVDIEPSQVDLARALADEHEMTNLRFAAGRGEALDFPDGSFDAVFTYAVVEHVPDPLAILREMRRVARPGGLAGVDASDWGGRVTEPHVPAVEEAVAAYVRLWEHNGGHARLGRRLRGLLRAAGFGRLQTTAGTIQLSPGAGELMAGLIAAPRFVERVTTLGWADRETIDRWVAALRAWDRGPDAVWAHLRFGTVGWAE
jgi:SAM-dependent methyltransferase